MCTANDGFWAYSGNGSQRLTFYAIKIYISEILFMCIKNRETHRISVSRCEYFIVLRNPWQ